MFLLRMKFAVVRGNRFQDIDQGRVVIVGRSYEFEMCLEERRDR